MPGIPCGFCAVHFWKSSLWINIRGKADSWPQLLCSQGNSCFFNQMSLNWETVTTWVHRHDRQRYWTSLVYVHKCWIEGMTCASGKSGCQEKAAQATSVLYNKDTCSAQESQGLLIGLKDSCSAEEGAIMIWRFLHFFFSFRFRSLKGQRIDNYLPSTALRYLPYTPGAERSCVFRVYYYISHDAIISKPFSMPFDYMTYV